jgi:hypothetical protein
MFKRFQWLCHKRSGRMYDYYMPVFVAMASGSRRYPDIIEAIKKVKSMNFSFEGRNMLIIVLPTEF